MYYNFIVKDSEALALSHLLCSFVQITNSQFLSLSHTHKTEFLFPNQEAYLGLDQHWLGGLVHHIYVQGLLSGLNQWDPLTECLAHLCVHGTFILDRFQIRTCEAITPEEIFRISTL